MSCVIVVYHCWCFPRYNSEHLLVLMFCECGSHLEGLDKRNGIHSEHSCEGWIVEERHSERDLDSATDLLYNFWPFCVKGIS